MNYELLLVSQVYVNNEAYGEIRKKINIPFVPIPGMTIRVDNFDWTFPQTWQSNFIYHNKEGYFEFRGMNGFKTEEDAQKRIKLNLESGASFHPYENIEALASAA